MDFPGLFSKGDVFSYEEMVEIGRKYLEPKWMYNKEKEELRNE